MAPPVDRRVLEHVARSALEAADATLVDGRFEPLAYDAYRPGREVERVEGRADVHGRVLSWSAIRKWTDSPTRTPDAPWERGRREALAYRSDLLAETAALAVPRPLLVSLGDDGAVDLWLEDVRDDGPHPWSLDMFGTAARALGAFNGASLGRPLPQADWLVGDWAERQSEPVDVPSVTAEIQAAAATPVARRLLGEDAAWRATRMLQDQRGLIDLLGRLPQVVCHHDAARSNLVARPDARGTCEIVAFDWELIGPGALGADIATLVSGSLRKGDAPAETIDALDRAVFEGYVAGLRDAGWDGEDSLARLGYAASLALRFWFVRDTLRNLSDPAARPLLGKTRDRAREDVIQAIAAITRFLLDRADEARELARSCTSARDGELES